MLRQRDGFENAANLLERLAQKIGEKDVSNSLLDAQGFKILGTIGQRQADQLNSTTKIDVDQLMTNFQQRFGTDVDGRVEIDFYKFGREVAPRFRSIDCTSFMKGLLGLQVAVKERKAAQRKKRDEEEEEQPLTRAELMADTSKEAGGASMTDKRVTLLYHHLPKEKTDFFRTLIHPTSFTQSIENLFDLTFLVKKGQAEVSLDPDLGVPFVRKVGDDDDDVLDDEDDEEAAGGRKGDTSNAQCIIKMDMTTWQRIVHAWKLEGRAPFLPDRTAQYKQDEVALKASVSARSAPPASASKRRAADGATGAAAASGAASSSGSKRRRVEGAGEEEISAHERMPAFVSPSQPTVRSYLSRAAAPSTGQMQADQTDGSEEELE